jgi:salicylate hydroxylase
MASVLIVGGGIGGLAAALAGSQVGAQVSLFERAAEFSEVGAGIQLGPNVMQVLQGWGLQGELAAVAAFPQRLQVCSARSGAELGVLRLGAEMQARYGSPYATIHRADLHAMLLAALVRQGGVQLNLGCAVTRYVPQNTGVTLQFQRVEQRLEAQADLLVGADGLWSTVRQQLLNDGAPRATGHLAYRAIVSQASLPECLRSRQVTVWLGPRLHVVQYPVRGGEWLNLVAIVEGKGLDDAGNWDHNANAAELQRRMAGSCRPLLDLICAIQDWRLWPLSIRPPMRGAHEQAQGRVALLGDAAHPMLPYLAQGAGMAIEDAAELARVLAAKAPASTGSPAAASDVVARLRQYAERRWQRNAQVQARAIRNGQIFHATGPMRWGRDAAMKLLGESLLDQPWLYRAACQA